MPTIQDLRTPPTAPHHIPLGDPMPVTMKAPEGCGGLSIEGRSYTPSKKGLVKVPDESVRLLLDWGWTVAPPEDSDDPEAAAAYLAATTLQEAVLEGNAQIAAMNQEEEARAAALKAIDAQVFGN